MRRQVISMVSRRRNGWVPVRPIRKKSRGNISATLQRWHEFRTGSDYMTTFQSLREVIDRGVELRHYEAVAVAQQLIASLDADVQPMPLVGPPSLDNVR